MTRQRFEDTVKKLTERKQTVEIVKTSKKKESFVSFHSAIKKILDKKYAYRPNIATTRVRKIKEGLKYEWKFKNYSLKINLYADSIALFINTKNVKFVEYFKTNSHNAIFKYPTDKQFALVYDKYNSFYKDINIELSNKILYLSQANYEYISLNRDLVEYLENIITTFEELDSQIELYKHATFVAKSTVKKITENLKPKKPTLAEVAKEKVKAIKDQKKDIMHEIVKKLHLSKLTKKDLYVHYDFNFKNFSLELRVDKTVGVFAIKLHYNNNIRQEQIQHLNNTTHTFGKYEITFNSDKFEEHIRNNKIDITPACYVILKKDEIKSLDQIQEIMKAYKEMDKFLTKETRESAIEKEWQALTHEQWMEKSEAARLKLIAAISKDREAPFVQVKNEESKVITCIQINALDKLPVKDLEDVLTRIEDATQVLNKEKVHKETLIKSIHTKYEEYSKLYKEIKGV